MRVTLKQADIIKGIALYLGSIGMGSVRAVDLDVDFSITRKDNAGLVATFDIPERATEAASAACAPTAICGGFGLGEDGSVILKDAVLQTSTITLETVALAEPVAEVLPETLVAPEPETLPAEPETAVEPDAPAAELASEPAAEDAPATAKLSLFGSAQ